MSYFINNHNFVVSLCGPTHIDEDVAIIHHFVLSISSCDMHSLFCSCTCIVGPLYYVKVSVHVLDRFVHHAYTSFNNHNFCSRSNSWGVTKMFFSLKLRLMVFQLANLIHRARWDIVVFLITTNCFCDIYLKTQSLKYVWSSAVLVFNTVRSSGLNLSKALCLSSLLQALRQYIFFVKCVKDAYIIKVPLENSRRHVYNQENTTLCIFQFDDFYPLSIGDILKRPPLLKSSQKKLATKVSTSCNSTPTQMALEGVLTESSSHYKCPARL